MENREKAIRKPKSLKRRILAWVSSFVIVMFAIVIAIPVSGMVYEKSGEYKDGKAYPPPGRIVSVNGHDMHIYAEGSGNATVVFSSGWGIPCPYADFYPLYSKISSKARTVVYDRPGYGWSEVCKSPRDIDTIVKEIHELLVKEGEKPPYIFVAHSLGSLEALRYAQLYKNEVKGIVMIDGGSPEFYSGEMSLGEASNLSFKAKLNKLGFFRLLFNKSPKFYSAAYAPRNNLSLAPVKLRSMDKAMYLKNMANRNLSEESRNLKKNALRVLSGGKLGNIPLRILTSESDSRDPKWKQSQAEFKVWSADSRQMVVKGSNHNMHQFYPDVINKEIVGLLGK